MSPKLFTSESKFLERTRTALTNAVTHAKIKSLLFDTGIDEIKISEGTEIYKNAKKIWELNIKEDEESHIASNSYKSKYEELQAIFKKHRDKTLLLFKKNPDTLITLGVKGRFPLKYNEFFNHVEKFYIAIHKNPAIQSKLGKIITIEMVDDCLLKYKELLAERADYDRELGESQDATQSKNAALIELKEWMDDFDTMAKIALYDHPQLLEVLGIFVRS